MVKSESLRRGVKVQEKFRCSLEYCQSLSMEVVNYATGKVPASIQHSSVFQVAGEEETCRKSLRNMQ